MKKVILLIFLVPICWVYAQDAGSARDPLSTTTDAELATSTATTTEVTPRPSTGTVRATTTPPISTPTQNPVVVVENPVITEPDIVVSENIADQSISFLGIGSLVSLIIFGGYGAYRLRTKKANQKEDKKDQSRCFDIKKMMDKKLEELTDLKGQLEDKIKETGREKIRETLQGTPEGKLLALIETGEEEYNRLKKLFDQCMIDFEIKKPILYVICGLPFSGKTFLAGKIAQHLKVKNISYDALWSELKDKTGRELGWEELSKEAEDRITKLLKEGKSVIYDTLNDTVGNREKLKKLAEKENAEVRIIYLDTPIVDLEKWLKDI